MVGQLGIARTAVTNPASGRVLERSGFVVTGRETGEEGELLVGTHGGGSTRGPVMP